MTYNKCHFIIFRAMSNCNPVTGFTALPSAHMRFLLLRSSLQCWLVRVSLKALAYLISIKSTYKNGTCAHRFCIIGLHAQLISRTVLTCSMDTLRYWKDHLHKAFLVLFIQNFVQFTLEFLFEYHIADTNFQNNAMFQPGKETTKQWGKYDILWCFIMK